MWKDLVTDDDFSRKDIITLQDPQNLESRNLSDFKYLKEGEDAGIPKEEATINTSAMGNTADLKIMKAKEAVAKARADRANGITSIPKSDAKPTTKVAPSSKPRSTPYNATHHTTGQAAASLTSTGLTPHTSASLALMTDEEYLLKPKRVKHKGYVRLATSLGDITFELYPEHAPKAVWNFVRLAQKGYYNDVLFHRSIRNFMIQTGDPTGTGRGGSSVWNKNFEDEFDGPLKHDGRGVVSMANKGKNTNSSQFFILYRQAQHLDRKHTIFGKVAEGLDVLKALEEIPVDGSDRPKQEIRILEAKVLVDPFEEFWKEKREREGDEQVREERRRDGRAEEERTTWTGKRIRQDGTIDAGGGGVGKYLKQGPATYDGARLDTFEEPDLEPVRKKAKAGGFGNFDNW